MVFKKVLIAGYLISFLLLVVSLNYYYFAYQPSYVPMSDFLEEPGFYQGDTISIMGKYIGSSENGFYVSYNQKRSKFITAHHILHRDTAKC